MENSNEHQLPAANILPRQALLLLPVSLSLFIFANNPDSNYAVILIDSPSEGGNLLTKEAMDAFWGLNSLVMDLEVQV